MLKIKRVFISKWVESDKRLDMKSYILCDIGNTTYHFLDDSRDFKVSLDDKLPSLPNKPIYFISVNKAGTKKLKKRYKNSINLKNIINFDTSYKGIGIDRIVACIGTKDGVIVDIGSAITVDIIENYKHKGGFILPGIKAYKNIYPNISKKLKFDFDKEINIKSIPLNTNDAINYAILNSIITPIKKISKNKNIILTGGDADIFIKYFKNSKIYKNLIFDNMKKVIKKS
jgi:type III pantothenate kinase